MPGLTPIQVLAVRYTASGLTPTDVGERLKVSPGVVRQWMRLPHVRAALDIALADHEALVSAQLLEGESRAAAVLSEALEARLPSGLPNWRVRLDAAMSLLDRSGQRGRAIERSLVKASVSDGNTDQAEAMLRKALKDPSVRAWIQRERPQLLPASESVEVSAPPYNEGAIEESA